MAFCFNRKITIGLQKKRKKFGKKFIEHNIAAIYVGDTSITQEPIRSLLGLKMKFEISGWNIGIRKNSSISPSRLRSIGVTRQEVKGVESAGV